MTYIGVFVDDEEDVYADQLSTANLLNFEFVPVSEVAELASTIRSKKPMIVALDYRLDEAATNLTPVKAFKGSALAQHLRDGSIENPTADFALVLVSAETKIRSLYRPDMTAHDLFDRVYVKEEINDRRSEIRIELLSLCKGYDALQATSPPYVLSELMCATVEERAIIDVQELRLKIEQAKAPHIVVRIILGSLIDRPGPLVDIFDACAHLGISSECAEMVATLLDANGARYQGLFSDAWPRWWMNRVESFASSQFNRRATGVPASERAKVISTKFGKEFKPAMSTWVTGSSDERIAVACACCRRGTDIRWSLAVFEPVLPRFATRRRICWDCIQTDRNDSAPTPFVVDETDQDLATQIKEMARPQPKDKAVS